MNEWFKHEMQHHRVDFRCSACPDRSFSDEKHSSGRDRYIKHMRREHPEIAEADGFELLLQSSQRPVQTVLASACPLCHSWEDRIMERVQADAGLSEANTEKSDMSVLPHVFKRHIAAHLEELALFAIPIASAFGDDAQSNAAFEEIKSVHSRLSSLSPLVFDDSHESVESGEDLAYSFMYESATEPIRFTNSSHSEDVEQAEPEDDVDENALQLRRANNYTEIFEEPSRYASSRSTDRSLASRERHLRSYPYPQSDLVKIQKFLDS